MISFRCDYEDGACPEVMEALLRTNGETTPGYGEDAHSAAAAARIRQWADCPEAEVFFTLGGTPTNAMTIAHLLRPYEAAIAAETGHINTHETGAVEATGHKVVTVPSADGKVLPEDVRAACAVHTDHHMVRPALLYLSQPTELGTLYSLGELAALRRVCDEEGLLLYCDGARLASALAARGNDVQVSDLARLCDAFYIGGTKCGALFGEALVFPKPALAQGFAYARKQRGGLLAKGRMLGVQFEALLAPGVYERIGAHENALADRLRQGIAAAGYGFVCQTRTNQLFPVFPDALVERLEADFGFHRWGAAGEGRTAVRLVTSWSTQEADVEAFLQALA